MIDHAAQEALLREAELEMNVVCGRFRFDSKRRRGALIGIQGAIEALAMEVVNPELLGHTQSLRQLLQKEIGKAESENR
jgi:hypothetical protein